MRPRHTSLVESLARSTPFVGPEALERKTGRGIELRLGANESPFGPSPFAVAAMRDCAVDSQNYGDPEGHLVRQELSRQLGVSMESIVLGSGIDELLPLCCRLVVEPGESVVTTLGSYPTFDFGASGIGAVIHRVPYLEEAPDLTALAIAAAKTRAKVLYLANPDNPSGAWHSPDAIAGLRARLPEECLLLLDEAYLDFAPSSPAVQSDDAQVIRLRTFSKAHGMAGLRIAYAVAHPDHALALNKIRFHFGVNCIAQAGALASLRDPGHVSRVVEESAVGRNELIDLARSLGLRPLPSHTNFVTVDVGSRARGEAILDALLAKGVFIRKPAIAPLDRCIRITIGRPDQRARFAEILEEVVRTV